MTKVSALKNYAKETLTIQGKNRYMFIVPASIRPAPLITMVIKRVDKPILFDDKDTD